MSALSPFGKKLRSMRQDRSMLLADISTPLQVSPSYISQIETGTKLVPDGLIDRLTKVMSLTTAEVNELNVAAEMSAHEFKIALKKGADHDDRALAHTLSSAFARLTKEQKQDIARIVKG